MRHAARINGLSALFTKIDVLDKFKTIKVATVLWTNGAASNISARKRRR
ncbi:MAG: hypothetical protein U1F27_02315 [Turneriella sp.]